MGLISTILIGFIVGLFARAIVPGKDALGFILTTLLGIGGALLGKYLGVAIGLYNEENTAGFFMSLVGAIIILLIYDYFTKRKADNF